MKRFFIALIIAVGLLFIGNTSVNAACAQNNASCDANTLCCNAPSYQCSGGYCKNTGAQCGTANLPCCNPPNAQCGNGLSCQGGYCIAPTTCGAINQSCCTTGNACNTNLSCSGGVCTPSIPSNTPTSPPTIPPHTSPPTAQPNNNSTVNCGGLAALLSGKVEINTAIGCIPVDNPNGFINFVLSWSLGIGGGIAFLLIIYASFMITTSSGNPERLKAGQELLTSAIAGLIMLIFSVFILRIIGVNVLGIFK